MQYPAQKNVSTIALATASVASDVVVKFGLFWGRWTRHVQARTTDTHTHATQANMTKPIYLRLNAVTYLHALLPRSFPELISFIRGHAATTAAHASVKIKASPLSLFQSAKAIRGEQLC
jgi:hypothetical protein